MSSLGSFVSSCLRVKYLIEKYREEYISHQYDEQYVKPKVEELEKDIVVKFIESVTWSLDEEEEHEIQEYPRILDEAIELAKEVLRISKCHGLVVIKSEPQSNTVQIPVTPFPIFRDVEYKSRSSVIRRTKFKKIRSSYLGSRNRRKIRRDATCTNDSLNTLVTFSTPKIPCPYRKFRRTVRANPIIEFQEK
ncbi:hypothetical protein QAD02_020818 [Eretmocerus hayati]|uniref:Uncharacterized protein n=1 Tax=Eretmocerus hayati TaxID=131215 RepID=A0ACC2PNP1_9HYME|nr:hypothetical protein QAD02_020818 [Eretmocerus hayati]